MSEPLTNGRAAIPVAPENPSEAEISVQQPADPELVEGLAHENPIEGTSIDGDGVDDDDDTTPEVLTSPTALASRLQHLSLSAQSIHADDYLNSHQSVAPPMHVSTTFRYSRNPDELKSWENINPNNPYDSHVYSRDTAPNSTRMEAILASILNGPALTYSSGLSAFHAMLVFLNPRRIAIGGGYHGCHGVIRLLSKLTGLQMLDLDCANEELEPGDVIHVETPLNPTGEARDLEFYAAKARRTGTYLTVDATFAPPPLLDPLKWGVDVVMHSGTKYFGGHSDMLCGVLAIAPRHATLEAKGGNWAERMREERLILGSVMGSFEGWLGVRSLRTLELRVKKQSADAEKLVSWLADEVRSSNSVVSDMVASVHHASLQARDLDNKSSNQDGGEGEGSWLRRQMPNGFGPVFAIYLKDAHDARRLPSKLHLFHHATSLGGVESLIEWRAMSDKGVDKRLVRVSVGIEGWKDLRDDLLQGFEALTRQKKGEKRAAGEKKDSIIEVMEEKKVEVDEIDKANQTDTKENGQAHGKADEPIQEELKVEAENIA